MEPLKANQKILTAHISGMDCTSCASVVTRTLVKTPGIVSAVIQYASESGRIVYESDVISPKQISEIVHTLGYEMHLQNEEDHSEHGKMTQVSHDHHEDQMTAPLVAFGAAILTFFVMLWELAAESTVPKVIIHPIHAVLATGMLFIFGRQFLRAVVTFFRHGIATMDTLVGFGTLAAWFYSMFLFLFPAAGAALGLSKESYFDVTIIVIGFVLFGKYLEYTSKQKTGEALQKLIGLEVTSALLVVGDSTKEIPLADVIVGNILLVKPGTRIPVDGMVTKGESAVDESILTGEPMPQDKSTGSVVTGGTMNTSGILYMKAQKVGSDTVLAHIIAMVEDAQNSKAPIERLADTISGIFVPVVLGIGLVTLIVWLMIGYLNGGIVGILPTAIKSFIGVLVIACPCALGLATPTAVITAVGRAATRGILVKDAESLEKLSGVTTVLVDKTGTITEGKPEVSGIHIGNDRRVKKEEIMKMLSSLETYSEHPIAKAVLAYAASKNISTVPVGKFQSLSGKGVEGMIGKVWYRAGNKAFMNELGVTMSDITIEEETKSGKTPLFLARGKTLLGVVFVGDMPRFQASGAVTRLSDLKIRVVMVTGDDEKTASSIAGQVGISEVRANVRPDEKLAVVREYQKKGERVAMVGDGVNDAPALAGADVGIAMATGTDVAIATANMTLLHGDIGKLVELIALSKATMRVVKQNLFWAFVYNIIGIPLAAGVFIRFGLVLNPVFAGAAMALSSISVVGNSLRLKTVKI